MRTMAVRIGASLLHMILEQGHYYPHLGLGYGRRFRLSVQHVVRQLFWMWKCRAKAKAEATPTSHSRSSQLLGRTSMSHFGRRRNNPFDPGTDKHFDLRHHCCSHVFLLTQRSRYRSLSTSICKSRTFPPSAVSHLIIYTTLLLFNMFVPIPQAEVSFDLISTYTLIELGHSTLWPDYISLLFRRPFPSTTLGHFRNRDWHSVIPTPVNSLALDRMFRPEALTVTQSWMEEKVAIT
jgi:hypothetical protein